MPRHETAVEMGTIPVLEDLAAIQDAAGVLAVRTEAYVVPVTVTTPYAPITDPAQKVATIVHALNRASGTAEWVSGRQTGIYGVAGSIDIGLHGNPYDPYDPDDTPDRIQFHHTPFLGADTQLRVTFAKATPAYLANGSETDFRLTRLLRAGKTDPRFADPGSFRQVVLGAGQAVLFRFNERTGLPLLHDFKTVGSDIRDSNVTSIYPYRPSRAIALLLRLSSN